jgi:hypothetical protein
MVAETLPTFHTAGSETYLFGMQSLQNGDKSIRRNHGFFHAGPYMTIALVEMMEIALLLSTKYDGTRLYRHHETPLKKKRNLHLQNDTKVFFKSRTNVFDESV